MYVEDKFEMVTNMHVEEVNEDEYTMTMDGVPMTKSAESRWMTNFGSYHHIDVTMIAPTIIMGEGGSLFNL